MLVFWLGEVGRSIYELISEGFQETLLWRVDKFVAEEGEELVGKDDEVPASLCCPEIVGHKAVDGEVGLEFFDPVLIVARPR